MSCVVAGIDLGTTNSVIAIPGQFPDHGVVFGNVTVIFDEFERLTHASAVCEVDGELVVGDDAKALASEGYTPARFVKKYMGTQKKFRIGQRELLPEDVSADVLRHLCRFAEKALGVKIVGAVITHPAYFDGLAINATKEAGKIAGLQVEGLLMEPVAAAMAYCEDDPNTNMRVLVYDLGGGTFDITLVERSGSAFRPRTFGGNRELGGYNFDKKIAMTMLQQLRDKGYVINIQPEQPERDARWATLMHYAEKVKFDLSAKGGTKATVRVPSVFKDDSKPSKAVQLNFAMSQQEFVELIAPEIDSTIRETWKVLENAKLKPDDIDLLVMVGGSSRIFAIQERLEKEFGLSPQFNDDVLDLSVAVGAAMVAAAAGSTENGVTLAPVPSETDEPSVVFSGAVEKSDRCQDVAQLTVSVRGGAGGDANTLTSADGKFYLEVDLRPSAENELVFEVLGSDGQPLLRRSMLVLHAKDAQAPTSTERPKAMLPKPISVETISGLSMLADEGVTLPFKGRKSLQTLRELTEISINLFQEDIQLTSIIIKGLSQPVPPNCRIELEIEIADDYRIKTTASVPSVGMEEVRELQLEPMAVPPTSELRTQFQQIRQMYDSQMENTPEGEYKARLGAEADMVVEEIETILASEFPEQLQAFLLIKKLMLLTKKLATAGGLAPPKSDMDAKFTEARDLHRQAVNKRPAIREQNYDAVLDAYEREARKAYEQNDANSWRLINQKLDEIIQVLQASLQDTGRGVDDIPLMTLMAFVGQEVAACREEVRSKQQSKALSAADASRCMQELSTAEQKLQQVDPADDRAAKQQVVVIYQQHVMTAKRIAGVATTGADIGIGEIG